MPVTTPAAGREARAAIDEARDSIAALLGAKPHEIIFTAGGTESGNLAILRVAPHLSQRRERLALPTTREARQARDHLCDRAPRRAARLRALAKAGRLSRHLSA